MPPRPRRTVVDDREDYADAMLTVQAACADDGASFFAEMTLLMAAWLTVRHAQGRPTPPLAALPELDAGESSPAGTLYHHAVGLPCAPRPQAPPADRSAAPAFDAPDGVVMTGPRPSPRGHGTKLSGADLYDLLKEGGRLKVPEDLSLIGVRSRLSDISRRCRTHRLRLEERPDEPPLIVRVPRKRPRR